MIFVEKATVTKDLIGNIKIRIKENNASLYGYINNILYVADQDGIFETRSTTKMDFLCTTLSTNDEF